MADPYVGEIRLFAGNFAPVGWAFCDGTLLSIAENDVLFALIGTTYGGDGQVTFALPDMRGRVPVHQGLGPGLSPRVIGEKSGAENVTLQPTQLPSHNHVLNATTTAAGASGASGSLLAANKAGTNFYGSTPGGGAMAPAALTSAGSGQAHNNMAPYLGLNFIISLFGIFPSQS
jgi:microcystin-dependent protein